MSALAKVEERSVLRPLRELSRLIKFEVESGKRAGIDAYEQAAKPFFQKAGELLLEAKSQLSHGEWLPWVRKQGFSFSESTAREWMAYAKLLPENTAPRGVFDKPLGLREITRPDYDVSAEPSKVAAKELREHVTNRITPGFVDRMAQARADEEKELRLVRELTMQIIDAGYKVLAMKLHPDKGGDTDAMSRLTRSKNRIKRLNSEEGL
jgi:hypothetical protein